MNKLLTFLFTVALISPLLGIDLNGQNERKPNIVLIVTDDQDVYLHGMEPMKLTQDLLAKEGVSFINAFTSSPICCPSRASILTGQYAHNHATINNSLSGGCYGSYWRERAEPNAMPIKLANAGYQTFFAGKYLNEYNGDAVPPGWHNWHGLLGNSRYYNYTLNENGFLKNYKDEYLTDLLKKFSVNFIKTQNSENMQYKADPFFMMIAPPAPHAPYTPADRHKDAFPEVIAYRTPNFNVPPSDVLDKHWLLQMPPKLLRNDTLNTLDLYYRRRWQSLLAVDELVRDVVSELEKNNLLNETIIIFTSDNGYHIGQFGQPFDKRQPYETDIRVPLIVRGPHIPQKAVISRPIALIDILPTVFDWAGIIGSNGFSDGISFAQLIDSRYMHNEVNYIGRNEDFERKILIEYWGEGNENTYSPECPWRRKDKLAGCTLDAECHCQDSWNNTYACLRHVSNDVDVLYCEFSDHQNFNEVYDLTVDPFQMNNIAYSMLPSERVRYSIDLNKMRHCIGKSCSLTY